LKEIIDQLIDLFFRFLFLGTNWIYIFSNIYTWSYFKNNCLWSMSSSECISTKWMESIRFSYRCCWV